MIKEITINSIWEGTQASQYFGQEGQFIQSLAIDPDYPISTAATDIKTSGFAVPVGYAKFSGANVTAAPIAIINDPKNNLTYTVLSNGRLISYSNVLGTETLIGTVATGIAQGATYYNNYIYIMTGVDVSRYGPLNNSPTLVDTVWTGATLGSQTALTNTTYPTLRSVLIPNHWGYVHGDGSLYFCDFINGQGKIHRINTKKVTDEGDTNGTVTASAYGSLTLPFGFYPTTIVGVNTNLMILGIYTTDATIQQGKSAFVMWDPTNTTSFFLGPVPLPDSLATAALNNNGTVYIWTGNAVNGVRLSQYLGGTYLKDILFQEEGLPPFAGAVDAVGNRIVWGGFTTNPAAAACVWAYGSKDARLPSGLHNIVKSSSAGATPIVTALKYVQQTSYIQPRVVLAFRDGTNSGLDSYSSSATLASRIRWLFNIGKKFSIQEIRVPFGGSVDATTSITALISFDDLSNQAPPTIPTGTTALKAINNTNNPSKRVAIWEGAQMKNYVGINNFVLEFLWANITALPIAFPIRITLNVREDEPA